MPTFVKLPSELWINLDNIVDVGDESDGEEPVVDIRMVGDADSEPSIHLVGRNRELFLKALSKFTMKEPK